MKFRPPVHLEKAHEPFLESFDCGDPVLNDWLKTKAIPNEEKKASRTYVVFLSLIHISEPTRRS